MSMPIIEGSDVERTQSVTDIIESIALEQTALSHILNAEGEKLQAVIKTEGVTVDQLLVVNNSVKDMTDAIARLEMMLQSKLSLFGDVLLPGGFYFTKKNSKTKKALSGATFELISNGEVVKTETSKPNGRVVFSDIKEGTYTMRESYSPFGYFPNDTVYDVVVTNRMTTIDGKRADRTTIYDLPYPPLTILVTDDLGVPLAGCLVEVKSEYIAFQNRTDENGRIYLSQTEAGASTVEQLSTVEGHYIDDTVHDIFVFDDGTMEIDGVTTNTLVIVNRRFMIYLNGTKTWVDQDNAGDTRPSELTVYLLQNGESFMQTTTDESLLWKYSFGDIPSFDSKGIKYDYTVDEDTPDGYTKAVSDMNITNTLIAL